MNQNQQTFTNTSKFSRKGSPQPRSKTPKSFINSQNRLSKRESKSLVRRQQPSQSLINIMKMQPIKQWQQNVRYYYLGKGNNHQAVKRALSQRRGLTQSSSHEGIFFKWTQNSFGFKYHQLGKECLSFNHFQFHRQISNKQRLVWNMVNFCQTNKLNAFTYIPTTFIIDLTTGEEDLALHGFLKFYNRNIPEGYAGTKVHSILLPRNKNNPYLSAQQLHKKSQGNFYCKPMCPKTFFSKSNNYLWILKPTFMNRGRGVSLFSNLSEFEKLIWKYYEGEGLEDYEDKQGIGELFRLPEGSENTIKIITDEEDEKIKQPKTEQKIKTEDKSFKKIEDPSQKSKESTQKTQQRSQQKIQLKQQKGQEKIKVNSLRVLSFVVQKYIQCPMLVRQRKFDIRVWALLTQNYEVFFFREGYLRFSSHKYSTGNHTNPFIHLTNNSVQKHCNQYDEQSGNQISLTDLRQYFPDDSSYVKVQTRIREMIWVSMCAARRKINVNGRKDCFQLFGYDFMIDEAYKAWLIEVNTNPAIQECSSVLKMLIPRMLDDMFKLTIDKIFGLKYNDSHETYPVKGFPTDENMWELLGDFKEGVNQKTMGKRIGLIRR